MGFILYWDEMGSQTHTIYSYLRNRLLNAVVEHNVHLAVGHYLLNVPVIYSRRLPYVTAVPTLEVSGNARADRPTRLEEGRGVLRLVVDHEGRRRRRRRSCTTDKVKVRNDEYRAWSMEFSMEYRAPCAAE